ncbi:hypothetical protein PAPYR_5486 [Paratrimastix pyriformis]|uniref:Uncharacterized protein n=1 Tax=Paratrimastix pyriformis TaxID=342808 RepID=A0ABQ8UMM6_9EUKA|nr:hypothetical protein PAPYR_5486 [Paratrimastix pyriformis]
MVGNLAFADPAPTLRGLLEIWQRKGFLPASYLPPLPSNSPSAAARKPATAAAPSLPLLVPDQTAAAELPRVPLFAGDHEAAGLAAEDVMEGWAAETGVPGRVVKRDEFDHAREQVLVYHLAVLAQARGGGWLYPPEGTFGLWSWVARSGCCPAGSPGWLSWGLGWAGLGWAGLGWAGLGWAGL